MAFGDTLVRFMAARLPSRFRTTFMGRNVEAFINPGDGPEGMSIEDLWRTQPHLRTVVDFRAANIAQLGLQAFRMTSNDDRERDRTSTVARVLTRPNPYMTGSELVYDLVATQSLYGAAYWFLAVGDDGEPDIYPFPPMWVTPVKDGGWGAKEYRLQPPGSDRVVTVPADQVVPFKSWSPDPAAEASSPVETLRLILEEQWHSRKHRVQLWKRNGRVGSYIARPKDAPNWDSGDRIRFYEMFEAFTGDKGPRAGGVPLLEDGMTLETTSFKSADQEWAESIKISLETVAQVYRINPTMVGVLDAANYSNMREFNRSLYTNSLGPDIKIIEDRLNAFVLPLLGAADGTFVKFNVEAKLRGSFEEQTSVMSTAVGAPWMTRNEARKLQDMPGVEGGDELVTPLNVLEGGQASPQDGETAGRGGGGSTTESEASSGGALSASDFVAATNAVGQLFRSGFDPEASLAAAGLPPIPHTGAVSVSVRLEEEVEQGLDQPVDLDPDAPPGDEEEGGEET